MAGDARSTKVVVAAMIRDALIAVSTFAAYFTGFIEPDTSCDSARDAGRAGACAAPPR